MVVWLGVTVKSWKFITLEGIEGSGKTLQLSLLEEEFRRRGVRFVSTQQPGGTPFGQELRQILLRADGPEREPLAELLLYLADRHHHLKEVIEPALLEGQHVICDRYHDATLAYQGYARGVGFETVDRLAEILELRIPDLTFVFDLEVGMGLERARQRNVSERSELWGRFEAEALDFHRRVREGYRLISQNDPERVFLIEASGPPAQVFASVSQILENKGLFSETTGLHR